MSFESFNDLPEEEKLEDDVSSTKEVVEKKKKSVKEIIEKWINITGIVGASFLAGTMAYSTHERNVEYDKYTTESALSPEDKEEFDRLNKVIVSYLGEDAIGDIRIADKKAYFERKEVDKSHKTEITGFEGLGLDPKVTEVLLGGELFPKNWVHGEVGQIEFTDKESKEFDRARAAYSSSTDSIMFYKKGGNFPDGTTVQEKAVIIKNILGHEIGHANDWDADTELDMSGRVKLLYSVLTILLEKYDVENLPSEELRNHVSEYWASMCMLYFSLPAEFLTVSPDEFKLVNDYVLSQDPDFNVFEKAGPYFDENGKPTDKLSELIKLQN